MRNVETIHGFTVHICRQAADRMIQVSKDHEPNEVNMIPVGYWGISTDKSPLRKVGFEEVYGIYVEDVIVPKFQVNTGSHTSISKNSVASAEFIAEKQLESMRSFWKIYGRVGKIHSHPFLYSGYMSDGDVRSNMIGDPLNQWAELTGVRFVPMILVHMEDRDYHGAQWNIMAFVHQDGVMRAEVNIVDSFPIGREKITTHHNVWPGLMLEIDAQTPAMIDSYKRTDIGRGWEALCFQVNGAVFIATYPPFPWKQKGELIRQVGRKSVFLSHLDFGNLPHSGRSVWDTIKRLVF